MGLCWYDPVKPYYWHKHIFNHENQNRTSGNIEKHASVKHSKFANPKEVINCLKTTNNGTKEIVFLLLRSQEQFSTFLCRWSLTAPITSIILVLPPPHAPWLNHQFSRNNMMMKSWSLVRWWEPGLHEILCN